MKFCIFIISFFLTTSGCKQIAELTHFQMEFDKSVKIPATTSINLPFNILTPDIETNSETTFAVNDTRKDLVEQIKLIGSELTITSPASGDFSFLKSVSVFISAQGQNEVKIAWLENIPEDAGKKIILQMTEADIKEYIKMDKFVLRLNTVTDEVLTSDYDILIHSVVFVDAEILGQ